MISAELNKLLLLPTALRTIALRSLATPIRIATCEAQQSRCFSNSTALPTSTDSTPTAANGSSVSHAEVSHFKALASSWWDAHGSSRLLHLMNPLRHKFIRQCLNSDEHLNPNTSKKLRYLDVGCGGGIFAESAARLSTSDSVTAIDPTPEVISVAQQHQRQDPLLLEAGRLSYINTSIEDLPLQTSQEKGQGYDILTLFEVIEHITHPSPFLQTCLAHLAPGGWLIGSTIARTNASWFTTKLMAEDVLGVVPRGTHNWEQYIQPGELREWAKAQEGLDASAWQVMGVVYVPGFGWREVDGSEGWGNYFFGMRKRDVDS